jgi:hypothetical protein
VSFDGGHLALLSRFDFHCIGFCQQLESRMFNLRFRDKGFAVWYNSGFEPFGEERNRQKIPLVEVSIIELEEDSLVDVFKLLKV